MEAMIPPLLAISAVANFLICVLIVLQGYRGVFIFAILGVACWDVSILFFHLNVFTFLNWVSFAHFFALVVVFSYYLFAFKFPRETIKEKNKISLYILPAVCFLVATVAIFLTNWVVGDVDYGNQVYVIGKYYPIYGTLITFYFSVGSFVLYKQFIDSTDQTEKQQVRLVLAGAIVSILIATVADLLLPYLSSFEYIWIGPFSTILLVVAVSVAILKYHLFSIKLIIAEAALILLNFLLFANAAFSQDSTILALNVLLSFSVLFFSILIIRGIYKDIKDRERIQKLANDMTTANKRLLALEQQKTEFISIASHQLRTPMTVIKGYASMVLEGAFGKLSPGAYDAMEKLYKASEKIVALIEDLLTVSRLEQGRGLPIFEKVLFAKFLRETLEPFSKEAEEMGLRLSFVAAEGSESTLVSIDKKKIAQALKHLIDNAMKYTKAPGRISVTLAHDGSKGRVYLSISDTGIGMTEEEITSLLHTGSLNDTDTRGFFGNSDVSSEKSSSKKLLSSERVVGIGFYIAQEIIVAHYGAIHIESEGAGRGTTVTVELPEV